MLNLIKIPANAATRGAANRTSYLGAPLNSDKVSYWFMQPGMDAPIMIETTLAERQALQSRQVPVTGQMIYTPVDTYLWVDPANGIHLPLLEQAPPPANAVTIGGYGSSNLLAPAGMDLLTLPDSVFEAVTGAKKPPPGQKPTQYIDDQGFLIQKPPPDFIWNGGFAPTVKQAKTGKFPAYSKQGKGNAANDAGKGGTLVQKTNQNNGTWQGGSSDVSPWPGPQPPVCKTPGLIPEKNAAGLFTGACVAAGGGDKKDEGPSTGAIVLGTLAAGALAYGVYRMAGGK
jgi:hypothetical protein